MKFELDALKGQVIVTRPTIPALVAKAYERPTIGMKLKSRAYN